MRLQLRELTAHLAASHEVCVLAFRWPDQHGDPPPGVELVEVTPPVPGLVGRTVDRARSLVRRQPVEALRLVPVMAGPLGALLAERDFDAVQVGLGQLAGLSSRLGDGPKVLAPLDAWDAVVAAEAATSEPARRLWLTGQRCLIAQHIDTTYRAYGRVVLVTERDARATEQVAPGVATTVITNGVDTEALRPDPAVERTPGLILFTGALHAAANETAARRLAERVLPLVRAEEPAAHLAIVGRRPGAAVRGLARLPGVQVEADVEAVQPWLARASVYACPLTTGTGIKNKLLEAMASGLACVASRLACEGMTVADGEHLLMAEDDEAVANSLVRLLRDPALADRIGRAARRYVEDHHSWAEVARRYEELYREVGADPRRSG